MSHRLCTAVLSLCACCSLPFINFSHGSDIVVKHVIAQVTDIAKKLDVPAASWFTDRVREDGTVLVQPDLSRQIKATTVAGNID